MDSDRSDRQLVVAMAGWMPAIVQCQGGDPHVSEAWPTPLVVRLRTTTPSIRGRTVDRDGNGVAGVELHVMNPVRLSELLVGLDVVAPGMPQYADVMSENVKSGPDGSFELIGLLPRAFDVRATHRPSLASSMVRDVLAGSVDVRVVLDNPNPSSQLSGRIVDPRGSPIAGAKVRARRLLSSDGGKHADALETEPAKTDAEGRFQFVGVSGDVQFLRIEFEEWGLGSVKPLPPTQSRDALEIVVGRIGHVRVEMVSPELGADRVCVLDQAGERLQVTVSRGGGWTMGSDTMPVSGGRTEAFAVCEDARTLVLLRNDAGVARIPITIEPGGEIVVRP
jgi:hypothetical protein